MRKTPTKTKLITVYKILDQHSLQPSRSSKQGKSETITVKLTEEPKTWQLNIIWYPGIILDQKEDIREKTNKIWIKYGVYLIIMCYYWFISYDIVMQNVNKKAN